MSKERWGTFSVKDHTNTQALATDVLLYDRLVFPAPPKNNQEAREWWTTKRWDPDFLDSRLKQLGTLAKTFDWGLEQHRVFKSEMSRTLAASDLANMAEEQKAELPYQMTRMIVAQEQKNLLPKRQDVAVVAAYQTKRDFSEDFILRHVKDRNARLGYLIGCALNVPKTGNPDATLEKAIGIACSASFRRKRRSLYNWQDEVISKDQPVKDDLVEFMDLISDYNAEVKAAVNKTRKRFVFVVGTVALDLASGLLGNPLAGFGGFLAVAEFMAADQRQMLESGPTAMFHHIDRNFA